MIDWTQDGTPDPKYAKPSEEMKKCVCGRPIQKYEFSPNGWEHVPDNHPATPAKTSEPVEAEDGFEAWHDGLFPAPVYNREIDETQGFLQLEHEWQYMKAVRRRTWQAALAHDSKQTKKEKS